MRLLGVDFGFKRIGLAIAESEFKVITPKPSLEATGTLLRDAQNIDALARREEIRAIILGLPIEEDGNQGKMARVCQTVTNHLTSMPSFVERGIRVSHTHSDPALHQTRNEF